MCLAFSPTKGDRLISPEIDVANRISLKGRKDCTCPPFRIFRILSPTLSNADGFLPTLPQLLNNGKILAGTTDKVSPFCFYATGKGIIAINLRTKNIHIVGSWKAFQIINCRMGYTAYGKTVQKIGASFQAKILVSKTPKFNKIATSAKVVPPPEPTALRLVERTEDKRYELSFIISQCKNVIGSKIQKMDKPLSGCRILENLANRLVIGHIPCILTCGRIVHVPGYGGDTSPAVLLYYSSMVLLPSGT